MKLTQDNKRVLFYSLERVLKEDLNGASRKLDINCNIEGILDEIEWIKSEIIFYDKLAKNGWWKG